MGVGAPHSHNLYTIYTQYTQYTQSIHNLYNIHPCSLPIYNILLYLILPTLLYSPTIKTFPHTSIYIVENFNKKCGKLLKFSTFVLLQCEKLLMLLTTFPHSSPTQTEPLYMQFYYPSFNPNQDHL